MSDGLENIKACVFDAYGTLFDVNGAAEQCQAELGEKWQPLADIWRMKQLNYTWLRSLMAEYEDFWKVTGDALDFALDTLGIDNPDLRSRLMQLYEELPAYSEVPGMLQELKERGLKTAILSNGNRNMLDSAVRSAGIKELLDHLISADDLKIYKPHSSVYQLAVDELNLPPDQISFMSSNAWDVQGAANFGFQVVWVNRFGQKPERLPGEYAVELDSLVSLPTLI